MVARVSGSRLRSIIGPDRGDGPTYLWLADGIRAAVSDGRILDGTRLPSERELAPALAVSRTTITRAYGLLVERGFAAARHGSGTTVRVPDGPAGGGVEPLGDEPMDPSTTEFVQAAPAATPGLQAAFEAAIDQLARYTSGRGYFPYGIPLLREAIAQRYTDRGVPTSADQIIVTTGASAGMGVALSAMAPGRARVLMDSPGYPNTVVAVRALGRQPVPHPAGDRDLDFDLLGTSLATAQVNLVVVDYKNPTGRLLDDSERAELAAVWKRHGTIAIVDETLCETWLDSQPDVLPMAAHYPSAISVGSASKTHWGGMRLGWIRAPHDAVRTIAAARRSTDLGSSVVEQLALAELFSTQPGLHDDTRAALRESRDLLWEFGTSCGWQADRAAGGLSLWWRLPGPHSSALVAAAAREGIGMLPGSAFAVDRRGLEGFIRTPFALRPHEIRPLLDPLRRAASAADALA